MTAYLEGTWNGYPASILVNEGRVEASDPELAAWLTSMVLSGVPIEGGPPPADQRTPDPALDADWIAMLEQHPAWETITGVPGPPPQVQADDPGDAVY